MRDNSERTENKPIKNNDRSSKNIKRKPSVLKTLKENQQKIRQEENGKGEKTVKRIREWKYNERSRPYQI